MRRFVGDDKLVHEVRAMWNIVNKSYRPTAPIRFLAKQRPLNLKFACGERALWMTDHVVEPTQEPLTCLTCLVSTS